MAHLMALAAVLLLCGGAAAQMDPALAARTPGYESEEAGDSPRDAVNEADPATGSNTYKSLPGRPGSHSGGSTITEPMPGAEPDSDGAVGD